jgi:hypothetical protein
MSRKTFFLFYLIVALGASVVAQEKPKTKTPGSNVKEPEDPKYMLGPNRRSAYTSYGVLLLPDLGRMVTITLPPSVETAVKEANTFEKQELIPAIERFKASRETLQRVRRQPSPDLFRAAIADRDKAKTALAHWQGLCALTILEILKSVEAGELVHGQLWLYQDWQGAAESRRILYDKKVRLSRRLLNRLGYYNKHS